VGEPQPYRIRAGRQTPPVGHRRDARARGRGAPDDAILHRIVTDAADPQAWLESFIEKSGGIAGTVHRVTAPEELSLAAAVRIPETVKQIVARVPRGKGMAGLAFERDEPISTCNIKTDSTGNVRSGARAVDAKAGVALPVHDAAGRVRAIVGVAFTDEKTLSEGELARLARDAATLP
jgi:L-methionine (R)-S-oxide reductase